MYLLWSKLNSSFDEVMWLKLNLNFWIIDTCWLWQLYLVCTLWFKCFVKFMNFSRGKAWCGQKLKGWLILLGIRFGILSSPITTSQFVGALFLYSTLVLWIMRASGESNSVLKLSWTEHFLQDWWLKRKIINELVVILH